MIVVIHKSSWDTVAFNKPPEVIAIYGPFSNRAEAGRYIKEQHTLAGEYRDSGNLAIFNTERMDSLMDAPDWSETDPKEPCHACGGAFCHGTCPQMVTEV